jgi:RNA polymerase sigma factor (sigma-70 family)
MPEPVDPTFDLLQRWYEGDRQALGRLLADNLEWIRRYLRRTAPPEVRARFESLDLVQEGALQLLRRGPRFAPCNRAQFRALVAKVLLFTVRDHLDQLHAAKRNAEREQPLPTEGVSRVMARDRAPTLPEAAFSREERRSWVQVGMELLQEPDREVIRLRQFEELPFDEVARRLGLASEDAARMRFNRALARLTVCIQRARSAVQVELDG